MHSIFGGGRIFGAKPQKRKTFHRVQRKKRADKEPEVVAAADAGREDAYTAAWGAQPQETVTEEASCAAPQDMQTAAAAAEEAFCATAQDVQPQKAATEHDNREQDREKVDIALEKEDFLLKQIDEFREKAKQLQALLVTREDKVQELQNLVDEREEKAKELSQVLHARREEADVLLNGVQSQMEEMIGSVEAKLTALSEKISRDVDESTERTVEQSTRMMDSLVDISGQLDNMKSQLAQQSESTGRTTEQTAQLMEALQEMSRQLDSMKLELAEKIHTEDVKCYRNMQNLIEELSAKLDENDELEKSLASMKSYLKCVTWFGVINFVALVLFILYSVGVFRF